MDNIEIKIKEILELTAGNLVQDKIINNDRKWTRDIITALVGLAYNEPFDYWVHTTTANDYDPSTREYLYDMMWYESADSNDLGIIQLVMECEWNKRPDFIKEDFYKLVQARAKHRLMIFQANEVDLIMKELISIVSKSKISEIGDRYLFAGWNDDNGFTFELFIKD